MSSFRRYFVLICLTAIFLFLRIYCNDPWNASVATNDTGSYVAAAEFSVLSTDFYTGPRPITLPLLLKLFTPPGGYDVTIRSEPSIGISPGLQVLPGFGSVAVVQSLISLLGWWFLAFAFYSKIQNPWLRFFSSAGILISASLPEITSWDHVLMGESLTYSLFAMVLGFSLFLFDEAFFTRATFNKNKVLLSTGFLISIFLWVNTRDTNVYFLLVGLIGIAIGLLIILFRWRFRQAPWLVIAVLAGMSGIYLLHQSTARVSTRTINPIINNLVANVFPYWTRVEYLHNKWGMPNDEDIISITGSANYSGILEKKEFVNWVHEKGMPAYMDFMITTPLWTIETLIESIGTTFGYYKQPYYDPYFIPSPINLKPLSRLVNWSSSDLILISFLLVAASFSTNFKKGKNANWPIFGILACLWLGAGLMYAASYLGETWGSAPRHVQNVILTYRLIILAFLPLQFDVLNS